MAKRFRIAKWVFMALAIVANGFLILYSCLPMSVTVRWNSFFTNAYASLINTFSPKKVEQIPMDEIELMMSADKYNYIPGYEANVIPLGSAKEISFTYSPEEATDTSIVYSTQDSGIITLNQSGSKVSVVGKSVGKATIVGTNKLSGLESSFVVEVKETICPKLFNVSLDKTTLKVGDYENLHFDIDGGPLEHNELHNFRYYDTRKLIYHSDDPTVASISSDGYIKANSVGTTSISVSNGEITKVFNLTINDGEPIGNYENLNISESIVCYENEMITDGGYQIIPKNNDTDLDSESFVWTSSDEMVAKIDQHGVVRGFRKKSIDDEHITIVGTSKLTGQTVNADVVVRQQIPTKLNYSVDIDSKTSWNPEIYTTCVGDKTRIVFYLEPSFANKKMSVYSSNDQIIEVINQGSYASLNILKDGDCTVFFESVSNPSLKGKVNFTVLPSGSMDTSNVSDAGFTIRKVVGHGLVFMTAQLFTATAFFMFLYDKKWYLHSIFALLTGLFMCCLSELIEKFVPSRTGSFIDVLIDFAGVVVGTTIIFAVTTISRKKSKRIN